jgi:four helix bundle protein
MFERIYVTRRKHLCTNKTFSLDEKYGLSSQIKRAVSVPNIAEGAARKGDKRIYTIFIYCHGLNI